MSQPPYQPLYSPPASAPSASTNPQHRQSVLSPRSGSTSATLPVHRQYSHPYPQQSPAYPQQPLSAPTYVNDAQRLPSYAQPLPSPAYVNETQRLPSYAQPIRSPTYAPVQPQQSPQYGMLPQQSPSYGPSVISPTNSQSSIRSPTSAQQRQLSHNHQHYPTEDTEHDRNVNLRNGTNGLYQRRAGNTSTNNNSTSNRQPQPIALLAQRMRAIDIFHKTDEEYTIKHNAGGIITVVTFSIIALLLIGELSRYLFPPSHTQISVETRSNMKERITIYYNLTFPALPCKDIAIDVVDVSGEQQADVDQVQMDREMSGMHVKLAANGGWMTQPYDSHDEHHQLTNMLDLQSGGFGIHAGAARKLMQVSADDQPSAAQEKHKPLHLQAVRNPNSAGGVPFNTAAMQQQIHDMLEPHPERDGAGCMLWGTVSINKVAGNMHIALGGAHEHSHIPGQKPAHVHQFQHPSQILTFNASHTINELRFGVDFPDARNPLNGVSQAVTTGSAHYQYFIKVIPTVYETKFSTVDTNQYSVTNHTIYLTEADTIRPDGRKLPGIFFLYDLSPFVIHISKHKQRFTEFVTSACAIVGGVLTIAKIVDGVWYWLYQQATGGGGSNSRSSSKRN